MEAPSTTGMTQIQLTETGMFNASTTTSEGGFIASAPQIVAFP